MKVTSTTLRKNSNINTIYCDFFDTLIHRNVHPNYVYKLWSKYLIQELGLNITINNLYKTRLQSLAYVSNKQKSRKVEVLYKDVIAEVYNRFINNNIFPNKTSFETFLKLSSEADYLAEISVQFTNKNLIEELRELKSQGKNIYLVSDFYLSKTIFMKILKYHSIDDIFDDVFISCAVGHSKENGSIYKYVLDKTNCAPESVLMIGDNKKSDVLNSSKYNIKSVYLKHSKHKRRNKLNAIGNDKNDFNLVLKDIEKTCKKSDFPYSQYIIFFTIFIERLYKEASKKQIKNIFFLAREGHFLKKMFDYYQANNSLFETQKINTHYFKISRQSAMQFALKELEQEKFKYLEEKYGNMSLRMFLQNFLFSNSKIAEIVEETKLDENEIIKQFVASESMTVLRGSTCFKKYYEENRVAQKEYFNAYFNSFNVDIEKEGITVVDVGWGGSMQQWLNEYFNKTVSVTGYYLGLKKVYDITDQTKRFGLNFSIYPNESYSDTLLMANSQLYEQLLSAPHGSTLGYTSKENNYTIEYHQENEKYVYDNYFSSTQDYMFSIYKLFLEKLKPITYEDAIVQKNMTDFTIRNGLFSRNKDLKFVNDVTQGFFQNIGNTEVGIVYKTEKIGMSKGQLLKNFFLYPEKTLRYIVKLKPMLYSKKKKLLAWLLTPIVNSVYYYIKFNKYIRDSFFNKELI